MPPPPVQVVYGRCFHPPPHPAVAAAATTGASDHSVTVPNLNAGRHTYYNGRYVPRRPEIPRMFPEEETPLKLSPSTSPQMLFYNSTVFFFHVPYAHYYGHVSNDFQPPGLLHRSRDDPFPTRKIDSHAVRAREIKSVNDDGIIAQKHEFGGSSFRGFVLPTRLLRMINRLKGVKFG